MTDPISKRKRMERLKKELAESDQEFFCDICCNQRTSANTAYLYAISHAQSESTNLLSEKLCMDCFIEMKNHIYEKRRQ